MDKAAASPYFSAMVRSLTIIAMVFVLAVVSFTAFAHGTGMAVSQEFGSGVQHGEHAAAQKANCHHDTSCEAETGLCDLVCMGVGPFLTSERPDNGIVALGETYRRPAETTLVATPPALDDRPPITHLL